MRFSGLLSRKDQDLPGVVGIARVDRRTQDLVRRVSAGDVVVIEQVDLDRRVADALVDADVAGVVNAAKSISGRFPNLGPEVLLAAGIPLIDEVGSAVLDDIKEGTRLRLHDGTVYAGQRQIASGVQQTSEKVADQMVAAKAGMSAQLEAFSADIIEFLRTERLLVLDGVGVPDMGVSFEGRHAVVLAPGHGHDEELRRLRQYIREYRPALIGVDSAADTLRRAGYRPEVIVGDPDGITVSTLKCGSPLVIPAHVDGFAPGLERVQDLGIGAVTFPASGNSEDLALLLAEAHRANLVVSVGFHATLQEFLDRGRSGSNPSSFLTRLKLGGKLLDGHAVAGLYRPRVSPGLVLLMLLAALVVLASVLATTGTGTVWAGAANNAWESLFSQVKGIIL